VEANVQTLRGIVALGLITILTGAGQPHVGGGGVRSASDPALHRVNDVVFVAGRPFTGDILDSYANGLRRAVTPYRNGRRDGDALMWYPNGQLMAETEFVSGREEGVSKGWWEDGRIHFAYRFQNGVLEGEAREWFRGGTLYRDFHYVDGHESGWERMWYPGGPLRANYVIRDGRRFGLPGTKGCTGTTPTESLG
jgi:hypothetical protein